MSNSQNGNDPQFRGRIYDDVLQTIGATPLVRAPGLAKKYELKADLVLKLEYFNPGASVKDRIALSMIEAAEQSGDLKPGMSVIEPTSGNTGIGLAFICAAKGYHLILTMPESMSIERRKMLALFGAELVLTSKEGGMGEAIAKAKELFEAHGNAFMPSQFDNQANPAIHKRTTALEIWEDTGGDLDIFIAGVGTGGTFTGCAEVLKSKKPDIQCYVVEPEDSPVIAGGEPGPHKIQGIGAGFIPDNLDTKLIDGVLKVGNDDSMAMAIEAARLDGLAIGISSGAALKKAIEMARKDENKGKRIVVVIPSFAERYLSTPLFDFYKEQQS